jgi:hypothetical protein
VNASNPRRRKKLTDDQLDALLDGTGQDLLRHVQACTDPTATLDRLLATPASHKPADTAAAPGKTGATHRTPPIQRITRGRRSWRFLTIPLAAAAALTTLAIVITLVATEVKAGPMAVPATHQLRNPVASNTDAGETFGQSPPPPLRGCHAAIPVSWPSASSLAIPFKPSQAALSRDDELALNSDLGTIRQYTARGNSAVRIIITSSINDVRHLAKSSQLAQERAQVVCTWLINHHTPPASLGIELTKPRSPHFQGNQVNVSIYYKANTPEPSSFVAEH